MANVVSSDTIAIIVVTVGLALGTGIAFLIRAAVSALLSHIEKGFSDQDKVNNETLAVVREVHNKVDSHAERLAYIEGKQGLPLGSATRKGE